MPKIKSPETFSPNIVLTAEDLQNHVDGAYPLPGFITEQALIDAIAPEDTLLVHDHSLSQLRSVNVNQIFGSGLAITTSSLSGLAGSNLSITSQTGRSITITSGDSIAINSTAGVSIGNNLSIAGTLSVNGKVTASGTGALKIPVGTTAERPSTPVAGDIRYNSTVDQAEIYSGTEWKAVGGSPFDASGGIVTTIDGFKIHTFTVSSLFTPSLTAEGKIEYLIVGGGGGGASYNPHGGGGGGGDVKTGFLTINKNTAPMSVVVGLGGFGNGTASSFGGITANGGTAGSGYTGGTSGSGIAGGTGSFPGAGGGAGAQTTQTFRWTDAGGVGGQGYGSSISGTLKVYGGGGGGGASGTGKASAPGIYGGGGQGANPTANSGGGGSGSAQGVHGATLGADGIVIIRYRVS